MQDHFRTSSTLFVHPCSQLVLMLHGAPAIAQNTGSIFGSVQDSSGAVIPGAVVTATDPVHAITRAVKEQWFR